MYRVTYCMTVWRGWRRLYLSVHEQVSHQGHGLPQGVPLTRHEGLVLIRQIARSGHHKLSDLIVQAVERLDRCKRGKRDLEQRNVKPRENTRIQRNRNTTIHDS